MNENDCIFCKDSTQRDRVGSCVRGGYGAGSAGAISLMMDDRDLPISRYQTYLRGDTVGDGEVGCNRDGIPVQDQLLSRRRLTAFHQHARCMGSRGLRIP